MGPIVNYFSGEKFQCAIGMGIALVSIALALYFLLQLETGFFKGMSYPFLILPVILLIICTNVVLRTHKDIERMTNFYKNTPEKIKSDEIPRMERVMQSFGIIKVVELSLIVIAIGILIFFAKHPLLKGIGFGLPIQAVMMYGFDHFAENRGIVYWEFLQNFN